MSHSADFIFPNHQLKWHFNGHLQVDLINKIIDVHYGKSLSLSVTDWLNPKTLERPLNCSAIT